MVHNAENDISELSSNSDWDSLHLLCANVLEKNMEVWRGH